MNTSGEFHTMYAWWISYDVRLVNFINVRLVNFIRCTSGEFHTRYVWWISYEIHLVDFIRDTSKITIYNILRTHTLLHNTVEYLDVCTILHCISSFNVILIRINFLDNYFSILCYNDLYIYILVVEQNKIAPVYFCNIFVRDYMFLSEGTV